MSYYWSVRLGGLRGVRMKMSIGWRLSSKAPRSFNGCCAAFRHFVPLLPANKLGEGSFESYVELDLFLTVISCYFIFLVSPAEKYWIKTLSVEPPISFITIIPCFYVLSYSNLSQQIGKTRFTRYFTTPIYLSITLSVFHRSYRDNRDWWP